MRESLLACSYLIPLSASALLLGVNHLRNRRRTRLCRSGPHVHPASPPHRPADEEDEISCEVRVVREAERILRAQYARVGYLYEAPTQSA